MNLKEKFMLWQRDIIFSYNPNTFLVINKNSKRLMIQKLMPTHMFEIHNKISKIHHKNLAQIYDCVIDENMCIVLEQYVSGVTIEQYYNERDKKITEDEAAEIILQICDGIEVLHDINIVHRDITPANVIISDEGIVKIIDYGISRAEKLTNSANVHDTYILGTEGYAAPEQFGFFQSNERTDIYAIGILFNYLLTGKLPSEKLYEGVYSDIIKKCTEFNPEKRYESIDRLRKDIKGENKTNPLKYIYELPGVKSKNIFIRILAKILYVFGVIFNISVFETYLQDFLSFVMCFDISFFGFVVPIIFFSDYMKFQKKIFINISYKNKRKVFNFLAWISIIFALFTISAVWNYTNSLW